MPEEMDSNKQDRINSEIRAQKPSGVRKRLETGDWAQWFMPIIPVILEAEIRTITF
jgi:hypothetical protein